ncbi:H+/gluconate symporter-like permease [Clostridium pascui]|uniref:GntP family permease n=1 Tax=Clostridium pascui TaxID=46609 RepID=UPI00195C36FF|nr:GntP family permease [Clostridium pascui]MBM7871622.1 H+/gluconate symporter-like permease [Clostridium pascui]
MSFDVFILVLAIILFTVLAYKRISAVILGPLVSIIVILLARLPVFQTLTGAYMTSAANYFKSYFFIFLVGAIFGSVYEETKAAKSIASALLKISKGKFTAAIIMCITGILTFGGISGFVVYFVMYPIALQLFRKNDLSRKILPAAISAGCWTWSMNSPGSPSIQNVIPMRSLGTSATAAFIPGMAGLVVQFVLIFLWLEYRSRSLKKKGYLFHDDRLTPLPAHLLEDNDSKDEKVPHPLIACIPVALILVCFNILHWQVEFAVAMGILSSIILMYKFIPSGISGLIKIFNTGGSNSCSAILNTALVVGFGGVVKITSGFSTVIGGLQNLNISPLWFVAITTAICAGVCGSASGGLGIAYDALKDTFISMGINLEYVHRISAIAAGTLDSLPHQGGQITLLVLTNLSHKDAYFDVFITQLLIPTITLFVVIPMCALGL